MSGESDLPAACRLPEFYRGKKIVVTGHTGFKGAWLSVLLAKWGACVVGISLPAEGDDSRALFEPLVFKSTALDIRDRGAVLKAMQDHEPELVFHLAAQSLVGRSIEQPLETLAANIMGTAHVIDAACRTPTVRCVLNVTSDKCYLNTGSGRPFSEDDALGGGDPYSASKACAEIVTYAWRKAIRVNERPLIATARAGNVIGGGDWAQWRLVPDIVRAVRSGQNVVLRRPSATRPWQHVLNPLYGYLLLMQALYHDGRDIEGAWNFGPDQGDVLKVSKFTRRVLDRWGHGECVVTSEDPPFLESELLELDSAKSHRRLGWKPPFALDQGIDLTVDWYRRVLENDEPPIDVTNGQITAFEKLMSMETHKP